MTSCCGQAEQSTAATLQQQLGAQTAKLTHLQQKLEAAEQEVARKTQGNRALQQTKAKLWNALTGVTLASGAQQLKGDAITNAIQQQAQNMARLQALEASSAVRTAVVILDTCYALLTTIVTDLSMAERCLTWATAIATSR